MKKILFMFMLLSISLFSYDMNITDNVFDNGQFVDICKYKDEVYILANEIYEKPPIIYHSKNGNWNQINLKIDEEPIDIIAESRIRVDSTGNIWVSSLTGLYKCEDGSWSKYFAKDNEVEDRFYTQFIFDKDNNIWVMSSVNNRDDKVFHSELYKYDHQNFDTVFSFKTAVTFYERGGFSKNKTLTYTADHKIIFQRTIGQSQEGLSEDSSFADIYIVNLDKTYERIQSDNALSLELDIWQDMNQNITHLYSTYSNEIWLLLSDRTLLIDYNDPNSIANVGSGISLYRDNQWILFNESNNLTKINQYKYDEMGKILDMRNGKYLLLGRKNCYLANYNSVQLEKLEWADLLDGSEYIKFNNILEDEKITKQFDELSKKENHLIEFHDSFIYDNEIWMLFGWGILKMPIDNFTDVSETISDDFIVYPNPAVNYIYLNIPDNNINSEVQIFNSIGKLVLSENFSNSQRIDISGLPTGLYFIKYNNSAKQIIINR